MIDPIILENIPQRSPFLFIEHIVEKSDLSVTTTFFVDPKLACFEGHFPGNPVMPGVLLCEAAFQSGALLMGLITSGGITNKTAVVSRIQNAKFKSMVRPGDTITIHTELIEQLANAAYMKGKITVNAKLALAIEFACTLVE